MRLNPEGVEISLNTFLYLNSIYLEIFKTLDGRYGVTAPSLYKTNSGIQRSLVGFGSTIKQAFEDFMASLDVNSCENQEYKTLTHKGNRIMWPAIYLNWAEMRKLVGQLPLHKLEK